MYTLILQTLGEIIGILAVAIGVLSFAGGCVFARSVDGAPFMGASIALIIEGSLVLCALHHQRSSYLLPVFIIYVRCWTIVKCLFFNIWNL